MTHNTLVVSLANHEPGLVLDKYILSGRLILRQARDER
jgi:hypothetical protein